VAAGSVIARNPKMINRIDSRIDGMRTRLDTASVTVGIFPPDSIEVLIQPILRQRTSAQFKTFVLEDADRDPQV
jgi:hypothetical protein